MILAAARANGENCATTPPFRNGVPNLHVLQCNDDIRRRLAMADISRSFPNAAMCPRPPVDQTTAIRTTRVALSGRVGSTHHEMQRAFAPPSHNIPFLGTVRGRDMYAGPGTKTPEATDLRERHNQLLPWQNPHVHR